MIENETGKRSVLPVRGQLVPAHQRSVGVIVRSVFLCDLRPLSKPRVDPDFLNMPVAERTIEALRYNFALLEYRLGSNGWLRAWAISTLKVLLFLLIPLAGLTILIALLVPAAAGLAEVFHSLEVACRSMFWAATYIVLTLIVIAALISLVGVLLSLLRR